MNIWVSKNSVNSLASWAFQLPKLSYASRSTSTIRLL